MMMSLDTDVESDSEENANKTKQEDGEVFKEEEEVNAPTQSNNVGEHPSLEEAYKEQTTLLPTDNLKEEKEEAQPKTAGGIIPQTKESTSLPGLTVRMDIPIIPMKVGSCFPDFSLNILLLLKTSSSTSSYILICLFYSYL